MMDAVKAGGDRQELHEAIRLHSMEAAKQVKEFGLENDLLERIAKDERFPLNEEDLKARMNPSLYVGRAPEQTQEFFEQIVDPILEKHPEAKALTAEINV